MNPKYGRPVTGADVKVGMLSSVARADLARVIVEEAENGQFTAVHFRKGLRPKI